CPTCAPCCTYRRRWGGRRHAARRRVAGAARLDVRTVALDDYLGRAGVDPATVSLVKLDLEGSELEALRGAPRTLAGARPALIVEFIPEQSAAGRRRADELFEFVAAFGYEAFVPAAPRFRRRPAAPLVRHDGVSRADILFLHPESEAWRLAFA
ncbi:MAG: FkbM family methyltransferase, partial [Actinobacteria bacterium]|nr:FkbM family methyltransferase [Actinomycetota bacterium]